MKKKILMGLSIVVILGNVVFSSITIVKSIKEKKTMERINKREKDIRSLKKYVEEHKGTKESKKVKHVVEHFQEKGTFKTYEELKEEGLVIEMNILKVRSSKEMEEINKKEGNK